MFFSPATLTSLGHVTQLGHRGNEPCPNPSDLFDHMVFDLNGVHRIVIRYCHCPADPTSHQMQLVDERWFPATAFRPSTSFTFRFLDFFQKLQDQSKCTSYDFYHMIIHCTDNAGLEPDIVSLTRIVSARYETHASQFRYNEICVVTRLWCNLKLLKWGGAGHRCGGVEAVQDGDLAVLCPVCPHPGKNTVIQPGRPVYA